MNHRQTSRGAMKPRDVKAKVAYEVPAISATVTKNVMSSRRRRRSMMNKSSKPGMRKMLACHVSIDKAVNTPEPTNQRVEDANPAHASAASANAAANVM